MDCVSEDMLAGMNREVEDSERVVAGGSALRIPCGCPLSDVLSIRFKNHLKEFFPRISDNYMIRNEGRGVMWREATLVSSLLRRKQLLSTQH